MVNPSERDINRLESIVQYCERIESYRKRFGDSVEDFREDLAYRDACSECVSQIGELAGNISNDLKEENSDIEWSRIKGLRNIINHNYGSIKTDLMWTVLTVRVPELKSRCLLIIEELNNSSGK